MMWNGRSSWCGSGKGHEVKDRKEGNMNCTNISILHLSQDIMEIWRGT